MGENFEQLLEEYRKAKIKEQGAYDGVTAAESVLRATQKIRDEVFEEVRRGLCPSLDRAIIALYGPDIAANGLRQADGVWQSMSNTMAELLSKISPRIGEEKEGMSP